MLLINLQNTGVPPSRTTDGLRNSHVSDTSLDGEAPLISRQAPRARRLNRTEHDVLSRRSASFSGLSHPKCAGPHQWAWAEFVFVFFLSISYDLKGRNRGSVPLKTESWGSKRRTSTNRGLPHPQVENVSDGKIRKTEEGRKEGWMQEGKKSVRTEDRDPAGYRPENHLILHRVSSDLTSY